MNEGETFIYFIGLVIASIAIGIMTIAPIGFLVFGAGIMISVAVGAILRFLKG